MASETDSFTSQTKSGAYRVHSLQSVTSRRMTLHRFSRSGVIRSKETLKTRLLEAKVREEETKRKHKEKLYRRKLITRQKKLQEELEYAHFPTMLGWYFDGFFTHHFLLNQQWADMFNAVEEESANRKEIDHRETFTEITRRNFWPPKVYGQLAFRGRGIYLDFREVIRDPPHTPPETNFEGGRDEDELLNAPELDFTTLAWAGSGVHGLGPGPTGTGAGAEGGYFGEAGDQIGFHGGHRYGVIAAKEFDEINRNDFYFDEDKCQFLPKEEENQANLYYDIRFGVWRIRHASLLYNGDWFFHDRDGVFILKDRRQPTSIYYFDNVWNIWKKREVYGPSTNGLLPRDYYYDELQSEWIKKKAVSASTYTFDPNGWRAAKRIPLTGPDDWYFDEFVGDYIRKDEGKPKQYFYDPKYGAWRLLGGENLRVINSPNNYYYNEQEGNFKRKDAPRACFENDTNNKFWRKKKLLTGLHNPKNWIWNNKKKIWEQRPKNRGGIFNQILHWRPARDYDKPWLDYVGKNIRGWTENEVDNANGVRMHQDDNADITGEKEGDTNKSGADDKDRIKTQPYGLGYDRNKPAVEKEKTLGQILAEANSEWGDSAFKSSSKRISFDSKGPGFITNAAVTVGGAQPVEEEAPLAKMDEIVDRSIDRKRLRCGNLNGMLSTKELKAFFVSARACVRPKEKNAKDIDDYMYLHFESDQAAAAAYRTMQHADIKGQKIELAYPRRYQI